MMTGKELRYEIGLHDTCMRNLLALSEVHGEGKIIALMCDLLETSVLHKIENRLSNLRLDREIKEISE